MKTMRNQSLSGTTHQERTGCGQVYIIRNQQDGKDRELFLHLGKAGGCPAAHLEAVGRLSALILRRGGTIEEIRQELSGIKCPRVPSCYDAVAKVLTNFPPA